LNDENGWHNVFYGHITSKVDESLFSVLYNASTGRPNAPVRQLFSMLILKEGHGWSDAQLFEECRFNILVMRALGLMNLNDEVPTESTYYLFKQLLYAYQQGTGQDLVYETFASLTQGQAQHFGVVGDRIPMDSKLIGSNIATCCRLQLIVNCLSLFCYNVNLVETCNEEGLNLVTDVTVKPASAADNNFVRDAIQSTEDIVGQVKEVSMDGAYNDADNTEYAQEENKQLYYTGLQGAPGRFIYERTEQGIEVTDRNTGEVLIAIEYKPEKYKVILDDKTHYFTEQDIDNYLKRKHIEELPQDIKNRRNNVEASIFQLSYHTRNGKTRYRGQLPHQLWATCRGLWMNLIRIKNYLAQPVQVPA
jgi:hypothetical protein